ncbi:MAG: hypothetical protein GY863_25420 [bacterium]|nr:hypothetical protein [bacterium]
MKQKKQYGYFTIIIFLTLVFFQISNCAKDNDKYDSKKANELIDQFKTELEERFAYLTINDADYISAIDDIKEKAENGISADRLGIEMQKVIALFIDGHARIEGYNLPGGYLPFLIEPVGERFVAFRPDRSSFVDNVFPFITKIDGKPISEWVKMSTPFIAKGSSQYVARQALRMMRNMNFLRMENKLVTKPDLEIELASEDINSKKTIILKIAESSPLYGKWPETQTKILDGNIGYLRILAMHEEDDEIVREWMPEFKNTDALIIDVRDNGGGSRVALRLLFPYLFSENDLPHVVNASAYRLYKEYGTDHLDARYSYREDSEKWTPEEKNSIQEFKKTFNPDIGIPRSGFSEMHYMVMSKNTTDAAYHYSKPVVILMNQKCFSATDIFLSAFKGWHDVTLIGLPSSGGSARSIRTKLADTDLVVRLASMISYQKDGKLYDTNGVMPDIFVEPEPEYFLRNGRDNILDFALEFFKK